MKRSKPHGEGHLVAYLRVSATDQNLDTQLAKVKALGNVDRVFKEKASGAKSDRKVLADCLAYLREGDTLVVTRADRIARSAAHLLTIARQLCLRWRIMRLAPYLNTLLMLSQMLRSPAPVSAVISLKTFMCASVAGPAIPSATSPFFC